MASCWPASKRGGVFQPYERIAGLIDVFRQGLETFRNAELFWRLKRLVQRSEPQSLFAVIEQRTCLREADLYARLDLNNTSPIIYVKGTDESNEHEGIMIDLLR